MRAVLVMLFSVLGFSANSADLVCFGSQQIRDPATGLSFCSIVAVGRPVQVVAPVEPEQATKWISQHGRGGCVALMFNPQPIDAVRSVVSEAAKAGASIVVVTPWGPSTLVDSPALKQYLIDVGTLGVPVVDAHAAQALIAMDYFSPKADALHISKLMDGDVLNEEGHKRLAAWMLRFAAPSCLTGDKPIPQER